MVRRLYFFIVIFSASFFSTIAGYAQCLTIPTTSQDVNCFGGNDGEISLTINAGLPPNAQPPWDIELFFEDSGGGLTSLAFYNDVAITSIIFTPGNGSLNVIGADAFGIPANDFIDPGSRYRIEVRSTGGVITCRNKVAFVTINQPAQLLVTLNSVTPDCDPTVGTGNGGIDITPSGGIGPYTITWTGPTAIPNGTLAATNLDAGSYTVDVEDANNCLTSLNINVPITTQANAGPPTALVCGTNSLVLSANAAGAGEIGTWSGPAGVTFSNVNDPTATVTNLNVGLNTLTWTIQDIGLICPGTTDNIDVRYSDVQMSGTPDVLLNCFGDTNGTGTFTVTGGSANYTYSIIANTSSASIVLPAPGPTMIVSFTGGGAGVVTLQVLDGNGCTSQATITLTQPPVITIDNIASTNVACFGASTGSIDVDASGGTGALTYTISPGGTSNGTGIFTGLSFGTYTVSVTDANGCGPVVTPNINITQPPVITIDNIASTNVACFGASTGSIDVDASGGTGALTYTISPGGTSNGTGIFTGLSFGTYTVSVTDANGCGPVVTPNINITQPPVITIDNIASTNVACFGASTGSIDVDASGGTGALTYTISPGGTSNGTGIFTGLSFGTYTVSVTDANGCGPVVTPNINITQPPVITIDNIASTNVACFGASTGSIDVDASGGTGALTYTISPGGTSNGTGIFTGLSFGTYTVSVTDANGCGPVVTPNINITQPPVITIDNIASTNVACFGASTGSIDVDASGGTGALTYTISPGGTSNGTGIFTGLSFGTYTVSVTDANGCGPVVTPNINITQPPVITIDNIASTNVACFGASTGSIDVDASGGTGALTYTISPGGTSNGTGIFTGLSFGTYTVSVTDANGCGPVVTPNINITQPPVITIDNIASTNVACFGASTGSIDVDASGGTGALTYTISPGGTSNGTGIFTGLSFGTYTVSVTDANGCGPVVTPNINITQPPVITIDNIASTNVACFGASTGSIDVDASGGTGALTYTISPGGTSNGTGIFTGLSFGTYTVSVTDANGCGPVVTPNINITQPPVITIDNIASTNVACFGASTGSIDVDASGGTGALTYTISPGGTSNGTGIFTGLSFGTYTVSVTDANGCGPVVTPNINITQPPVITIDNIASTNVACFGASTGSIDVDASGGTGALTYTISPGGTSNGTGIFTGLSFGTYTVSVTDANGCGPVVTPNINITQPPVITIDNIASTNVACFGASTGSIDVDASGGTGALTYTISPGGTSNGTGIFTGLSFGTYTVSVTDANGCGPVVTPNINITQPTQPVSAVLSGNASICVGQSTGLTITFADATGPTWDFVYSDGSSTFNLTANSNPFTFTVNPVITTTYSLVSLIDATCGAGTVSGVVTVTVNPIPGDQVTFGNETWIGYVYDDSSSPFPPVADINFSGAKYRGYIEAADIDNMSASSTYEVPLDTFDMNIGAAQIFGPNVCGTYANDFSVRYKMRKTFTAGVYTFTVGADDGVRLFVDGVNVITAPGAFFTHSYTEFTSSPICLTSGTHDLIIEYFERGGDARMSFTYSLVPAPTLTTISPLDVCVNSATPTLSVSSADPSVIDFNWYTDAALTNLVFTGANYTPALTELDMAAVGTSDFFVTAVYTGGCESPANTILVNVVNGASLTLPPADVCESGGVVDLTTIVSASPSGGTFTFTGTGVTGSNFDPAGLSGLVAITVDYSVGGCSAPTGTLNLTVTNTAAITVPGAAIQACETAGTINLLTLVSGTPGGGSFTFSGPQVTGNTFDPTGLSGIQTILVDYNAGGCVAPQAQFNIDVTSTASLTITNSNVCQNGGPVNLLSYVSATPAGGVFSFSGTGVTGNTFNPTGLTGPISISVTYTGVCNASGTLVLTVLDPSNPLCGGGGVNCNVFTVTISDTRPSCAQQDDGTITINVSGGVPNYVVTLSAPGFSQALPGPAGNFVFSNLSPNNYQYTILDLSGNTCTLPYSLPIQTNVDADASGFVDVACFGEAVGQATLTVNSGGSAPYEYSLDGLTWINFTSPHTITNLPPNGNYAILVRDDATDQCPDQVPVTINNINPRVKGVFNVTNATCNGNDGAIEITTVSGGIGGPYSFKVDNGAVETILPFTFTGLSGGGHLVTLIDNSGCERDTVINVSFPGFVTYSAPATTVDATCTTKGMIVVFIPNPPGSYEAGYTTDPLNEPVNYSTGFYNPATGLVTIPDLNAGTYYVWLRTPSAACATRFENSPGAAAIVINGPQPISFEVGCRSYDAGVTSYSVLQLNNISASSSDPLHYEIFGNGFQKSGDLTPDPLNQDTIRAFPTGDFVIWLWQNQTIFGCTVYSDTLEAPEGVLDTLSVTVTESFPEQPTGSMNIKISESGAEPYQLWLVNDPFLSDTLQPVRNPITFEVSFTSLASGTYTLYLEDATSCRRSYEVVVPFDGDIFVPNVFTPNNDGINENFYVRNLPSSGSKLIITNRWGKEVFSSGNYNPDNLWDGGDSPDGVYYYRLQIKDGDTYTGWVEIMRGTKP